MRRGEFLASDDGQRLVSRSRSFRRIRVDVDGIEPRSKTAMPTDERRAFRELIRSDLVRQRRRPYRGPLVLTLGFVTTERNPSHIHTLAKNFLDLLGSSEPGTPSSRPLLYRDDEQVYGLTVRCEHGGSAPHISVESRSLGDFREDLWLAMTVGEDRGLASDPREEFGPYSSGIEWDRDEYVRVFGEDAWRSEVVRYQQSAQRSLLRLNGLSVRELANLYRSLRPQFRQDVTLLDELAAQQEKHLLGSPFRITLQELPQRPGASAEYRTHVLSQLRAFRSQYKKLLVPIQIPVGLEVIVKPPPSSRTFAAHDLDNILRRYLVPGVVETFEPPSHFLWAEEAAYPRRDSQRNPPLPVSTTTGLIRMEAWRVPRTLGDVSPGYVSVAIVPDDHGYGGTLRAVDRAVDAWLDRD